MRFLGFWYERARIANAFQRGERARAFYELFDKSDPRSSDAKYEYIKITNSEADALVDQGDFPAAATPEMNVPRPPATPAAIDSEYLDRDGRVSINGVAYRDKASKEAQLWVKIGKSPSWGDYQVLATDYEHVALVYSRTRFALLWTLEQSWVLVRDPSKHSDQEVRALVQELVAAAKAGGATIQDSEFVYTPPFRPAPIEQENAGSK